MRNAKYYIRNRLPQISLILGAVVISCDRDKDIKRPNIIFIMADDHGCQAISSYGHPISRVAPTPNIDRIAKSGVIFTNSFVENAISAPSRATLLTGMYSGNHGQTTLEYGIMDTTITHFPELLQRAGYRTALFGKWHLSFVPKGFDYYDIFNDQGEYYNPLMKTSDDPEKYYVQKGYATEIISQHAMQWLDSIKDSDAPFCLMLHHKAPHRNWMPALDDIELYNDIKFPEPSTLFDDYGTRTEQMRQHQLSISSDMGFAFDFKVKEYQHLPTHQYIKDSWTIAMSSLSDQEREQWDSLYFEQNKSFLEKTPIGKDLVRWKYQRFIQDYCRTVHRIDIETGRLLDFLEENDLLENTIIIYTSDQGFYLGEHGLYDKRFMYEEALRTPLLISWKNHIKPGSVRKSLVQNIDLAPSILDVAGVDIPKNMEGSSILPLFESDNIKGWRRYILYRYYDCPAVGNVRKHYGIRTSRHKLIHWKDDASPYAPEIDSWELFDLQEDPHELKNVYDNPTYGEIREKLKNTLEKEIIHVSSSSVSK